MAERTQVPPGEDTGGQVQDKAQELAGEAQDKAQEAAGQARDRMREQVDQRSTEAGERVRSQAQDLRSVAEHLRGEGKDQPARMAEQAADRAERLGGYLADSDADRMLRDLEDFGRRRPWAVLAGGMAVGFAASRLLKASSIERYRATGGGMTRPEHALPAQAGVGEARFERPASTRGGGVA
jgi:hypothetical protein